MEGVGHSGGRVDAKNPFHRIELQESSQHLRIVLGGETLAETRHPVLLLEKGLPPRFYIPKGDVRMDLLTPSNTVTTCPVQGTASEYWSADVGGRVVEDVAWSYPSPKPECAAIANMICFYQERVDDFLVDGRPVDRSHAHRSV